MVETDNIALIASIGLIVQAAGAAALVLLFLLLRQHLQRRNYFVAWGNAFLALLVALVALFLGFDLRSPPSWAPAVQFVYQVSKVLYYGLLLAGALMYVRGTPHRRFPLAAALFALAWGGLSFVLAKSVDELVVWQTPVAFVALGACAWLLLTLPEPRRTLGSRVTGSTLLVSAVVWAGYCFVFLKLVPPAISGLAPFNGYLDLMLQTIMAIGMVLVLLEDARREIDAAHAELAHAHERLLTEAYRDALTGSLNRRAFSEGVGLEAARSTFGAVVMLDLDDLKDVNDRFGHAAGDDILRHLIAELRLSLRTDDKIYRMGGDEFLVVLPRARAEHALPRLDLLLKQAPRLAIAGRSPGLRLKVSLGGADYASAEELAAAIHAADQSMYATKRRRKESGELDTGLGGAAPRN